MSTSTACPRCRTVVPGGQERCLRCGHAVAVAVRDCPACGQRIGEDDRFCVHCGHAGQDPGDDLPSRPETDLAGAAGIFREYRSHRRPVLVGLAVFGALVVALCVLYLADWYFFRPARTVESYFDALADRDLPRARALLIPGDDGVVDLRLLDQAVLRSDAYEPPSGVRIESVETQDGAGDRALARVTFALGGQRQSLVLVLRRDDQTVAGVFHRWRIVGGVYPVSVRAYGVDAVVVGGLTVPFGEGGNALQLAALPGDYSVELPEQPLLAAPVTHAYPGGGRGAAVQIVPTIRPGAREEVDQQIRAKIDQCATATTLTPPDCPFGSFTFNEVRNVHWKIIQYPEPQLRISRFQRGQVVVETVERGQAEVTGVVDGFVGPQEYRDEVTFSVSGTVTGYGGTVTWLPEDRD